MFVQLAAIGCADLARQVLGATLDPVQHAEIEHAAAIVEQAVPGERGINLDRHRRIRRLPGQMRAVGQREIGLVIAGHRLFASQHNGRLRRILADMARDHLVDADTGMDQCALGDLHARQQAAGLGRMDALIGQGFDIQAVNDIDLLFQGLERLQRLAELHVGAVAFGAPVIFVHAAAQEHNAETLGEIGCRRSRQGTDRLQPGQRHSAAGTPKDRAAGEGAGDSRTRHVSFPS